MAKKDLKYTLTILTLLFIALIISIAISSSLGAVKIDISNFLTIFSHKLEFSPEEIILRDIRLPRILLAALTGGVLASCGVVFQALLRNDLAEPYILGISGGAALGAIIAILLGINFMWLGFTIVPIFAFCGAIITLFFVWYLAQIKMKIVVERLLLVGVVINYVFSASIMFLVIFIDFSKFYSIMLWLMGNLYTTDYEHLFVTTIYVLVGLCVLIYYSNDLNIISCGDDTAKHLGIDVERVKIICFIASALLIGAIVSLSGIIGFVGLIIPHIMRLLLGSDNRVLIPTSFLAGGIFLVICDTIARTILAPTEIPVGIITSIIGGPIFIMLLKKNKG